MAVHFQNQSMLVGCGNCARVLNFDDISQGWSAHIASDPMTQHVSDFADAFVANGFPAAHAFLFVRLVCAWGGLRGNSPAHVRQSIYQPGRGDAWLAGLIQEGRELSLSGEYENAIQVFDAIQGIRISFRSKILRFVCPDDAAVLDAIIRKNLGYPENLSSYREFVTDCKTIRDQLNSRSRRPDGELWRTTDVEMGIFIKVKS
jgi:hypothetical protein